MIFSLGGEGVLGSCRVWFSCQTLVPKLKQTSQIILIAVTIGPQWDNKTFVKQTLLQ